MWGGGPSRYVTLPRHRVAQWLFHSVVLWITVAVELIIIISITGLLPADWQTNRHACPPLGEAICHSSSLRCPHCRCGVRRLATRPRLEP